MFSFVFFFSQNVEQHWVTQQKENKEKMLTTEWKKSDRRVLWFCSMLLSILNRRFSTVEINFFPIYYVNNLGLIFKILFQVFFFPIDLSWRQLKPELGPLCKNNSQNFVWQKWWLSGTTKSFTSSLQRFIGVKLFTRTLIERNRTGNAQVIPGFSR